MDIIEPNFSLRMVNYQSIDNDSVIYPSIKPSGGSIVTCMSYDPPLVDLPHGSKYKVCNNIMEG